jgi:hypothetical protein
MLRFKHLATHFSFDRIGKIESNYQESDSCFMMIIVFVF